jgi:ribonucleoside-diphosphate reductase alpha chain
MFTRDEVYNSTLAYFNGDELATNVWMTKYALKNKDGEFQERTPDDMHQRLASEFARVEKDFNSGHELSQEQVYEYLKDFKYIVPQGSPMMGIGNNYVNVSLSNCVVVESPRDNISSIVNAGRDLANLFKRRCGVGLDISNLRPDGATVNNSAGTTTGAWSFADFYSYVCRMIGQNGRRGALMITMDVRHPDIKEFVTMKHDLTKVTGANVSIKISDDFMEAVRDKKTFTLSYPIGSENPTHTSEVDAESLWNTIVESATKTAEPGLLMWGNIEKTLPAECYADVGYKTICTNPCAEIPLSAYDSCRLISLNLKHLVENPFTKDAKFNYKKFAEVVKAGMRLSDDLVTLEEEKLAGILDACDTEDEVELWTKLLDAAKNGRRTGLGTHGLADALARLCLPYDSEEAIEAVSSIYATLRNEAYRESVILARERGSFPVFDASKEMHNEFLKELPSDIRAMMVEYGRRNISILTNAPTGSVSIMSQTSSGLEPVFRNSYIRRRKLETAEYTPDDFVDDLGDHWREFEVYHHNVQEYFDSHDDAVELPSFFTESDQIDWLRRIEIQSAIQENIDHAISSTINLPKDTPTEVVSELYLEAWKQGLKGVTIYVDGSRTGVLVTNDESTTDEPFPQHAAPKRPEVVECDIHHTTIQGEKWVVLVGLMDGKPYEVLAGEASLIEIPKRYVKGTLTKTHFKTKNNRYDLTFGFNGDSITVKDVVKAFDNPNNSAFTRMISLGLRHGAEVRFMVEQLQKDRESDMFSFSKCIARILKIYIKDGEVPSDKTCSECGSDSLVYQDGCVTCTSCGYAKCG